jgi:hypothetical protein
VATVAALLIVGFCKDEVNPFGPTHEYVDAPLGCDVKFRLLPVQIGLLLEALAAGVAFTATVVVVEAVHDPFATVTV